MKTISLLLLPALLLVAGTGCARDTDGIEARVQGQVERGLSEARTKLATEPLDIEADGQPNAELDADGTFRIDGREVATTPEQRVALQAYHAQLVSVADAGIEIGGQAAALAGTAVKEALRGVFRGNPDETEKRIEAEARKIEIDAQRICERVAVLKQVQEQAAAAVPEFAPYATMTQSDVDDCKVDTSGVNVDLDVDGAGETKDDAGSGGDPAAEADAAAEQGL